MTTTLPYVVTSAQDDEDRLLHHELLQGHAAWAGDIAFANALARSAPALTEANTAGMPQVLVQHLEAGREVLQNTPDEEVPFTPEMFNPDYSAVTPAIVSPHFRAVIHTWCADREFEVRAFSIDESWEPTLWAHCGRLDARSKGRMSIERAKRGAEWSVRTERVLLRVGVVEGGGALLMAAGRWIGPKPMRYEPIHEAVTLMLKQIEAGARE